MRRRSALRASGTLVVTGLAVAYILWRVDLRETVHVLANASVMAPSSQPLSPISTHAVMSAAN